MIDIIVPSILICMISCLLGYGICQLIISPWLSCLFSFLICDSIVCLLSYRLILSQNNRKQALAYVRSKIHL